VTNDGMRLVAVEKCDNAIWLTFQDGEDTVHKQVAISYLGRLVANNLPKYADYEILKRSREAVRDFAFLRYGNAWREHVPIGKFWSVAPQDDEERGIVKQVKKLLLNQQ